MSNVIRFRGRPKGVPAGNANAASPEYRAALEGALERVLDTADFIVGQLDAMDGDPDREPDGDEEPSLGAPAGGPSQVPWAAGSDQDLQAALSRLGHACRVSPHE